MIKFFDELELHVFLIKQRTTLKDYGKIKEHQQSLRGERL